MFKLFKSKEIRRIEVLFKYYKTLIDTGGTENEALLNTWGEMKKGSTQLKDEAGYLGRSTDSKKALLWQLFQPVKVEKYDIFGAIEFIVSWEFTEKYNSTPSIENIRSQKDPRSLLSKQVKQIGEAILQKGHAI